MWNEIKKWIITDLLPVIAIGVLILAVGSGLVYGAYRLWSGVPHETLVVVCAAVSVLILPWTWLAWHFGHTESRGFMAGADRAMDAFGRFGEKMLSQRTSSQITLHRAANPFGQLGGPWGGPGQPQMSMRQLDMRSQAGGETDGDAVEGEIVG